MPIGRIEREDRIVPPNVDIEKHKHRYEAGEYPDCFRPLPPFYNICTDGGKLLEYHFYEGNEIKTTTQERRVMQCRSCYRQHNFDGRGLV